MKKIKYLLYFIILVCLVIVVYSNWAFFSSMQALNINIYKPVYKWPLNLKLHELVFNFPPVATVVYLLGCFIAGYLLANLGNLVTRFKSTKQIKTLEASNRSNETLLADLRKEVEFLQRNAAKPAAAPINQTANTNGDTVVIEKEAGLS